VNERLVISDCEVSRRSILTAGIVVGAAFGIGSNRTAEAAADIAVESQWPFEIFDAHPHASPVWFQPVESLIAEMDRAGVSRASICQFFNQFNNDYEFEVMSRFPGRFSSIVHVDASKFDAPKTLKALADRGACGVRLSPSARSPGKDSYAVWKSAAECGLSISTFSNVGDLLTDDFTRLVQTIPQTPIVLEHGGGAYGSAPLENLKKVYELSRFPNIYIMIGGLGEFATRASPITKPFPFVAPIPPVIDMAYDAFGPKRMMWGSDFPASARREGFGNALRFTMDYLSKKSVEDRAWIFGRTASKVFPVSG
jgi:L-fuconolactonase